MGDTKSCDNTPKSFIQRPQLHAGYQTRSEKMSINQPETETGEFPFFDKEQNLVGLHQGGARQCLQQGKNLFAGFEVAAGKLANHKRVTDYLTFVQEVPKFGLASSEMLNLDRGINEHHAGRRSFSGV